MEETRGFPPTFALTRFMYENLPDHALQYVNRLKKAKPIAASNFEDQPQKKRSRWNRKVTRQASFDLMQQMWLLGPHKKKGVYYKVVLDGAISEYTQIARLYICNRMGTWDNSQANSSARDKTENVCFATDRFPSAV